MAAICYYGNVMATTRWRLCVTMETLSQHSDNVYFCCWRCIYWACYRCILHLQQYSHRLNLLLSFFGTRRFITVLTSARHLSLSWANSIQSSQPPPTSWRSIFNISSHLRLGLPNGLFPSGFSTRTLCAHPSPIPRGNIYAKNSYLTLGGNYIQGVTGGKDQTSGGCSLC